MIYKKIRGKSEKTVSVHEFSEGINNFGENARLEDCSNMFIEGGSLKSRKGLRVLRETPIFRCEDGYPSLSVSAPTVRIKNKNYRVSIISETNEVDHINYAFTAVGLDGTIKDLGKIRFTHVQEGEFYQPVSVTVFSSTPQHYSGIYAFFGIENARSANPDTPYDLRIYEYDYDSGEWQRYDQHIMYTPLYYINGRGTKYEQSGANFPKPTHPEGLNMIGEKYKCSYCGDGLSTEFYLPTSGLTKMSRDNVTCYVTTETGERVFFEVRCYGTESQPQYLNQVSTKMVLDREKGKITFIGSAPPNIGASNNIEFTVNHCIDENIQKIALMSNAVWYNADSSGPCLCLSGNSKYPSTLAVSAPNDPFYFPNFNCFSVGEPTQRITAMAKHNKTLMVFKDNEIYGGIFSQGKFALSHIHSAIGCDLPATLVLCGNRIVWANSSGKIYTLNSLSDYGAVAVYCISKRIDNMLSAEDLTNAGAAYANDKYTLCFKNKAYVMDISGAVLQSNKEFLSAAAFTKYEFSPEIKIKGVLSGADRVIFIAQTNEQYERGPLFIADLSGEYGTDQRLVTAGPRDFNLTENRYECFAKLNFGVIKNSTKKMFDKLYINSFAQRGLTLEYINAEGDILKKTGINMKYTQVRHPVPYRLLPMLFVSGLGIILRGTGEINLSGYTLYYREMY